MDDQERELDEFLNVDRVTMSNYLLILPKPHQTGSEYDRSSGRFNDEDHNVNQANANALYHSQRPLSQGLVHKGLSQDIDDQNMEQFNPDAL